MYSMVENTSSEMSEFRIAYAVFFINAFVIMKLCRVKYKFIFSCRSSRFYMLQCSQVPNPSFFRVLLPRLGCCFKIYSLSSRQSPIQTIRLINNPNLTKSLQPLFHPRFSWGSFHLLKILSRALFSGDQGYYSSSSEACQDHQKLNSFTPLPSSLPTSRTLSHKSSFIPRTCNLWNVLPSSCFPESYNLPSFKSKIDNLDPISLSS